VPEKALCFYCFTQMNMSVFKHELKSSFTFINLGGQLIMANIKLHDLSPAGSELFQDSESFLNELNAEELNNINGGLLGITLTITVTITITITL